MSSAKNFYGKDTHAAQYARYSSIERQESRENFLAQMSEHGYCSRCDDHHSHFGHCRAFETKAERTKRIAAMYVSAQFIIEQQMNDGTFWERKRKQK